MTGLRNYFWRRFGTSLTGFALGLQLMLSSLSLVIAGAAADPAAGFDPSAICHTNGESTPANSQGPTTPAHNHAAYCCLWHQAPAIQPTVAAAAAPTVFAYLLPSQSRPVAFSPNPRRGPVNARAPPTLA
jgi:hypothetical protein